MDDTNGAEAAMAASASEKPRPDDLVSREAVSLMIERYAARLVAGPAIREHAQPINRIRYTAEEAEVCRIVLTALAQSIRTGLPEPETYWPHVAREIAA